MMYRLRGCIKRTVRKVADDKNVQTYRALYAEQFGMFVHLATKSKQTRGSQKMLEKVLMNGLRQLEERIVTVLLDRSRGSSTEGSRVTQLQNKILYCEDFLMQKFRDELYSEDAKADLPQADDLSSFLVPVVSEHRRGQILRGALQEHEEELVDVLNSENSLILDALTRGSILTQSDEDDIKSGSTRTEKNRRVLRVLATSSPAKTETCFLAFLKTHHAEQALKLHQTMKDMQTRPLSQLCAACTVRSEIDLGRIAKTLFKRRAIQRGEYLDLCNPSLSSEDKWKVIGNRNLEGAVINALTPKFQHYYDRLRGVKDLECRCDEISEPPSSGSDYLSLCDNSDLFGNTDLAISNSDRLSIRTSSDQGSRSSSFPNVSEKDTRSESEREDYDALKEKLSDLCTKVDSILEYNSTKSRLCQSESTQQMSCHLHQTSGDHVSFHSPEVRQKWLRSDNERSCPGHLYQRHSATVTGSRSNLDKEFGKQHNVAVEMNSRDANLKISPRDLPTTPHQGPTVHFHDTDTVHHTWSYAETRAEEMSQYQTWI